MVRRIRGDCRSNQTERRTNLNTFARLKHVGKAGNKRVIEECCRFPMCGDEGMCNFQIGIACQKVLWLNARQSTAQRAIRTAQAWQYQLHMMMPSLDSPMTRKTQLRLTVKHPLP